MTEKSQNLPLCVEEKKTHTKKRRQRNEKTGLEPQTDIWKSHPKKELSVPNLWNFSLHPNEQQIIGGLMTFFDSFSMTKIHLF